MTEQNEDFNQTLLRAVHVDRKTAIRKTIIENTENKQQEKQ